MNTVFVDSLNWLEYATADDGTLWLLDYPHSEAHGGGPQGQRKLVGNAHVLNAFAELLHVLARHSEALHRNQPITRHHLSAIGDIAAALASAQPMLKPLSQAVRTFGWSFLPEAWGESVESAWAKFAEAAKNERSGRKVTK